MKGYFYKGEISDYYRTRQWLIDRKADFTTMSYGSAKFIEVGSSKMKFVNKRPSDESVKVQSACRLVRCDAVNNEKFKEAPNLMIRTKEINMEMFREYEGKDIAGIDIRSCYWNIALRDGIISLETYLTFHDKKLERNMAIGNLAKDLRAFIYKEGVLHDTKTYTSETKEKNRYIRYKTYELYKEIQKATGNKVMLLKTDEIFLPIEYAGKAKAYINSQKLMCTPYIYHVKSVDRLSVTLWDYGKQSEQIVKR